MNFKKKRRRQLPALACGRERYFAEKEVAAAATALFAYAHTQTLKILCGFEKGEFRLDLISHFFEAGRLLQ